MSLRRFLLFLASCAVIVSDALAQSTAGAPADSLALERAPTRIRGTVINGLTGTPLSHAVVIAHTAPDDAKHPVTADAAGRFTFENFRGTTMLEVRCPGLAARRWTTLAAPSFYVRAGMDTTLTITIPDFLPCWVASRTPKAFHVHRQQSGWLESDEARSATYPIGEAVRVYHAVLDAIIAEHESSLAVVSYRTSAQCLMDDECGGPQLARLVAEQVVDSTTVRDFIRASRDTVTLNPTLLRRDRTLFMTPADSAFLMRQVVSWVQDDPALYPDSFWKAFQEAYREAPGIVTLSRVGFNADSTQAIVEARLDTANAYHAIPEMLLLTRSAATWRITRRHIERETTVGALRDGRCVPVRGPGAWPDPTQLATLSGDFLIREVTTSRSAPEQHFLLRFTPISGQQAPSRYPLKAEMRYVRVPVSVEDITASDNPRADHSGSVLVTSDGPSIWISLGRYFHRISPLSFANGAFSGTWGSSRDHGIQIDSQLHVIPNPSGYFCATPVNR